MSNHKRLYVAVDDIQEGMARIEFDDRTAMVVDAGELPRGTKPNDVLRVRFEKDDAERDRRLGDVRDLQMRLLERTRRKDGK